jgi:flagellar hook-associated protein 2
MAAVGLNFGSPTSGTGFDVSTTVSEIMANYQMVEVPWNDQLSTLSTEDAAWSTIGTDLSNLSTAYGALQQIGGALQSMEGSSSDTSVLALDSANSSAVAGTHSVIVNQLATNDSWSSSAISSTATLDAGSITLQVGTGTASTINITAGESLSSLESAINSAGVGIQANVLTGSAGQYLSLDSETSGTTGAITIGGTLTASTGAMSWNHMVLAQDANLTVDGNTITSSSNTISNAIPGVTFQVLAPSPTTTSGGSTTTTPVQVMIANDTADVTSAINLFVSAYNTVMTAINTQEGDTATGTPEPLFGNTSLATLQEQLGSMMNSVQTSTYDTSATPVAATDMLTGTLAIGVGSGSASTFSLGSGETLATLASQINGTSGLGVTASVVAEPYGTGSYLKLVSQTSGTAGNLQVTGTLTDTTAGNTAINLAQTADGSSVDSFGAIGVSSLTFNSSSGNLSISANAGGLLSVDSTTLTSALNNDFQSVVSFFQDVASVGQGFFNSLAGLGTSTASASGGITSEGLYADEQQESSLNADISNENIQMSSEQEQLTTELDLANETLQAIPSQVNEVNELYAAITGYNTGTSS